MPSLPVRIDCVRRGRRESSLLSCARKRRPRSRRAPLISRKASGAVQVPKGPTESSCAPPRSACRRCHCHLQSRKSTTPTWRSSSRRALTRRPQAASSSRQCQCHSLHHSRQRSNAGCSGGGSSRGVRRERHRNPLHNRAPGDGAPWVSMQVLRAHRSREHCCSGSLRCIRLHRPLFMLCACRKVGWSV